MGQNSFIIVARPGTVFNLTDCGIPLDITAHKPIDLLTILKQEEIDKSMQLREALRTGALHHPAPAEVLPEAPAPDFTIPVLKPTSGALTATVHVTEHVHKHAPSDFTTHESIPESVQQAIASGIAKNKAEDAKEIQEAVARQLDTEEAEAEAVIRNMKAPIPVLSGGLVDGKPIPPGYEFRAPESPALDGAKQGMGDQLPEAAAPAEDPLGANATPPVKGKSRKGSRKGTK